MKILPNKHSQWFCPPRRQRLRSILSWITIVIGVPTLGFANDIVFDGFDDGDYQDGTPMSWSTLAWGGSADYKAVGDDVRITSLSNPTTGVVLYPQPDIHQLQDTSVRGKLRVDGDAGRVWLWAQGVIGSKWVWGFLERDGTVFIRHVVPGVMTDSEKFKTNLRFAEEDVMLQLDIVGVEAKLYAWRPDEPFPSEPHVTLLLPSVQRGYTGAGALQLNGNLIVKEVQFASQPMKGAVSLPPSLALVNAGADSVEFKIIDSDDARVVPSTVSLTIDGEEAIPSQAKAGDVTTITFPYDYGPGSEHRYSMEVSVEEGEMHSWDGQFLVPIPILPLGVPLDGPEGKAGHFGVRYIWGVDEQPIDDIRRAIEMIQSVSDPKFLGSVFDSAHPSINYGDFAPFGVFSAERRAFPNDIQDVDDWSNENFVQFAKGTVFVEESGFYTFGVHTDDGFALRIMGSTFTQVRGNGRLDLASPDTVVHRGNTSDTDTRAVVHLEAGEHDIEFLWYESSGAAFGELYAARGEFLEDSDTDSWALVGEGMPLVAKSSALSRAVDFRIRDRRLEIDVVTSDLNGLEVLVEQSATLEPNQWRVVEDFSKTPTADGLSRLTTSMPDMSQMYYRVRTASKQPLFIESFENDVSHWTITGNQAEAAWEIGEPVGAQFGEAHSGVNVCGTNLDGPYGNNVVAVLRSPLIDLTNIGHRMLSFWYFADMPQGEDGVVLAIRNEEGDLLVNRIREGQVLTGRFEGWTKLRIPMLAETRGQRIHLEWTLLSDGTEPNGAGFFLDDVVID